jgi:hypothetical protein
MKCLVIAIGCALTSLPVAGQSMSQHPLGNTSKSSPLPVATQPLSFSNDTDRRSSPVAGESSATRDDHQRIGVVSDWSQRQVLFPATNNPAVLARVQKDPRWAQSWYLHHREAWWPRSQRRHLRTSKALERDWSVSLGTVTFAPLVDSGHIDPGGGQTYPAKYNWDVTATPDCDKDFVAMGLPATPVSGGQANIVGFNNLYSSSSPGALCSGTGPNVLFAYASGTGIVPASISVSLNGKKLAYVEDQTSSGESFFHVLTWEAGDGTDAIHAIVPGSGNPDATDLTVQLTPDGGLTNQLSTTAPFIDYTSDAAYVTTYSWASPASGYLYKISPVFGPGTPAIVWSAAVDCTGPPGVPSSPVYDSISNHVLLTDSGSRVDYVLDSGSSPTVTCGPVGTFDNSAANPPVVDTVNQFVYAGFNNNGATQYVTQVKTTPAASIGLNVGAANSTVTGPYTVDFSNDYYDCNISIAPCSGTPLLYVAGMDSATGTIPTLYAEGFAAATLEMNGNFGTAPSTTALATAAADSSPVTEFFNDPDGIPADGTDYLFVGVTNNCAATTLGLTAGCVMSLNITGGAPTVTAATTAIPAAGGPTGIVVDNDSTDPQASSIYYATKTGATLVKATQSGLN